MLLSKIQNKKITNIYDYFYIHEQIITGEIQTKSLDNVIETIRTETSNNEVFVVPLPADGYEWFAILSPCPLSILKGRTTFEYTISIVSITQLNFSFHILKEMYILFD